MDLHEGAAQSLERVEDDVITTLPDELMLLIFGYLNNRDIVFSVANVCLKWRQLTGDPELWRDRFVFYNSCRQQEFIKIIQNINNPIRYLHLGGHETLGAPVLNEILGSGITQVQYLNFLSSCRSAPDKVLEVLAKFGDCIETLALCLNDEIVSYGQDGKTCYAITDSKTRPGILINCIGGMKNLQHLKLYGGFSTKWYFGELLQAAGCNRVETLDIKDFGQIFENSSKLQHRMDFVESIIRKNKTQLRSIKLSVTCGAKIDIRGSILECHGTLRELLVDASQMKGLVDGLKCLTSLHLGGRLLNERGMQLETANYIRSTEVFHNLTELTLIQFSYFPDVMFHEISRSCHSLRIFRMEGPAISGEEIGNVLNGLSSIEKLCIRDTDITAEGHLVSMELKFLSSKTINFGQISDLDCIGWYDKLKNIPLTKLQIFETGCDCKIITDIPTHLEDTFQITTPVIQANSFTVDSSLPLKGIRVVHIVLSNNLNEEYLCKFHNFTEDDLNFHFKQ